jgi:hypothetical protein
MGRAHVSTRAAVTLGLLAVAVVVPTILMAFSRYDNEAAWRGVYHSGAFGTLLGVSAIACATVASYLRPDRFTAIGFALAVTALGLVACALGGAFGDIPQIGPEG